MANVRSTGTAPKLSRAEWSERITFAIEHDGCTISGAARRFGISSSFANAVYHDPTGEKERARKESYRRPCPGWNGAPCGRMISGSEGRGPNAPKLCVECAQTQTHESRYWTRDRIIDSIRVFARIHGRPPTAREWLDGSHGRDGDGYPYTSVVQREFGTWNAAIEAAGYEVNKAGRWSDERRRSELMRARVTPEYRQKLSQAQRRAQKHARDYGELAVLANVRVGAEQFEQLKQLAKLRGIPYSEAIRRAIDRYIDG